MATRALIKLSSINIIININFTGHTKNVENVTVEMLRARECTQLIADYNVQ